ncbi:MAG: hypothetical protein KQI35_00550 [Bacteroidetes bacterium]|nr:hypothetical protein [Bacteroidota bacterium]
MKTFLKILGIIIVIIIVAALLLPIIFKGKLVEIAKTEINKNVNAKVEFADFSLSLFKSFPNFNFGIEGLIISGVDDFEGDTLANIGNIDITIDLMTVISGDKYQISRIGIDNAKVHVKVLKTGEANYDIAIESTGEETTATTDEEASPFTLSLKNVIISNATIVYDDAELNTYVELKGMNHRLNGDLTADATILRTKTTADKFTIIYEGIPYLNKTKLHYDADIDADLKNEIYTLNRNELKINELALSFDGSVSMLADGYNLILTFNAPQTDFKHFLSLVPAIYTQDFASIQTNGKLGLTGYVKGVYNDQSLPAFEVNLTVDEAMFKYPDLPQSVRNINIRTKITSPGGDADNTIVDVSKFHMELGQNPFDMSLLLKTPVSDPDIRARLRGTIDLAGIGEFYPLEEGESMKGTFNMDVTLEGKLSAVENENYEDFTAIGSLLIKGFDYQSNLLKERMEISNAQLNFSPRYLDLVSFKSRIGRNDFNADGRIENYLAYALKDEPLQGTLTTYSTYFNLNDFMPETDESIEESPAETDTTTLSVIEVPANIDFTMKTTFMKLIFDNIEMENVGGRLFVKDQQVILDKLSMNLLSGEMALSGKYSTAEPDNPNFAFDFDMKNIDIQQAYQTFDIVSQYAPIAEKIKGNMNTRFDLNAKLGPDMMPLYETMTGGGELSTSKVTIENVNSLNKIADALKIEKLKRMDVDKIRIEFEFVDGKIMVEPFDLKYDNFKANIAGWTALDQSIDYAMDLNVPRAELGSAANEVLSNLVTQANAKGANFSLGDNVSVDISIGGTLIDPKIKTAFGESSKSAVEDVKQQVKEEIEKKKEEITKEAREKADKIIADADAQAKKLIAEAEKQAEAIRKTAAETAKTIRDEADKQAKKVEEEGKKKGFLAEAAAKESAKKIRQEADKQANNVTKEADDNANALVNKAKKEAAALKQKANNEADQILKGN